MGQTLTHGVYLPDEGERNCYSGLAANWQILDSSVGTIAANTEALAGKAPLVHTHVKADITDFPVYGTTAGTICEGNDSRLSDARTPVAHAHTKSDVTDLLNSDFIPNANNSYDLGSSSNQWNNLYAKRVNTQSVNGVNPGALSLPSSSYIEIDTTNWILTGADNSYRPPADGYIFCGSSTGTDIKIFNFTTTIGSTSHSNTVNSNYVYLPVRKNDNCIIGFIGSAPPVARFYPCLGNV